ncbi:MAG TPA: FecR domain-containing protein [Candidatus Binatus sp.]|uniref:FecR family protein n=1 Tax=Candidatus Binatus sp. TaxID=2811406 RepID=UPI002B4A8497|nr:FecR domain-containing protein [Candidatus Binatus sp.]HKN14088.1 FecR domain-containing protein [Candidatus Binatus sp.]
MNSVTGAWRIATSLVFILTLLAARSSVAEADNSQVAQIKTVSGQAEIVRNGARTAAKIGDPLYEKDTIETGGDGAIGITFIDNTVMSSGPNSEIVLEDYKFNSSNFKGSMLTDMNRGTVSMISGDIARSTPGAMKVKTPTAILGVRGTRFVIEVKDNR